MLNKQHSFSRIVNVILRLEDRQVQEFMETYVCEYSGWDKWQKEVGKIPHEALQQHAVEKGQTVDELLEQYRPPLHTERITPEDREIGAIFLLDFPTLAQQFDAFEGMRGFLLMDIEWNYIQDAIDKQRISIPVGLSGSDDALDGTVSRGEYLVNLDMSQLLPDTRSFSPLTESLLSQMSPPQTYHEYESDGPFGSAAVNDTFSPSFGHSTPPPTPSSRLREMLDDKYRDFLEEEKKLENESSSEDDGEGIGNMVVPEPEKDDEEYCPDTKKRSSKRTRKLTLKKKESDKMMAQKRKNGGSRKQKKLQEDSEVGEDIQKTPTKRKKGATPGDSDPPSSGRIKLIVRSSRNATPTKPKVHRSTNIVPSEDPFVLKDAPVPAAAKGVVSAVSAVSAKHAIYAAMSTSAHFAQTAVRRSGQSNETEIEQRIIRNQIEPNELRTAFENIRSEGVQYADRASFAWKAEKADCAGIAFEADDANEVLTGEGKDNA